MQGEKIQCIPDDEVAFHSGNYEMNRKSIGIENCHPDWNGKFNNTTYKSLIELCAYLCKKYNIPISNVIRHYDVTKKDCPHYYVINSSEWQKLKQDISNKLNENPIKAHLIAKKDNVPLRNSMDHGANNVIAFLAKETPVDLLERKDNNWGVIAQGYINIEDFDFISLKSIITNKNGVPLRSSPSHTENNVITYVNEYTPFDLLEYIDGDFGRVPQGYINLKDCK